MKFTQNAFQIIPFDTSVHFISSNKQLDKIWNYFDSFIIYNGDINQKIFTDSPLRTDLNTLFKDFITRLTLRFGLKIFYSTGETKRF
jgi:hypothetical protein